MTLPIVLRSEAREDIGEAFDWYEGQKPGLGVELVERVQENLDRIADTPQMHQVVYKNVRKRIVQGFPYSIYYRIEEDRILVISVSHQKRNPAIWKKRARNNDKN